MRVAVVVARRYNGHELWTALGIMQERGHQFDVISTSHNIEDEVTGQRNTIPYTLAEVSDLQEYDALMIVSGNMADTEAYWRNPTVQRYVQEARDRDMPIAAICCSVPTIRSAAKDKRVSFFPLVRSRELLQGAGAILQTVAVSVDGKLVTAEHQMATQVWAESFCSVMEGRQVELGLKDSGYTPLGRPRKPNPTLQHLREVVSKTGKLRSDDNDDVPSE